MKKLFALSALILSVTANAQSVDTGASFETSVFATAVNPTSAQRRAEYKSSIYANACAYAEGEFAASTVSVRSVQVSHGRSGNVTYYHAEANVSCTNFNVALFNEAVKTDAPTAPRRGHHGNP